MQSVICCSARCVGSAFAYQNVGCTIAQLDIPQKPAAAGNTVRVHDNSVYAELLALIQSFFGNHVVGKTVFARAVIGFVPFVADLQPVAERFVRYFAHRHIKISVDFS